MKTYTKTKQQKNQTNKQTNKQSYKQINKPTNKTQIFGYCDLYYDSIFSATRSEMKRQEFNPRAEKLCGDVL